ncbi:hypothetical protein TRFO_26657 [Tritrichomonas foetus]|uniref:EF-hand domain-containing protein n=1 Tax=Tritrichomonas foetus TaxID=1144522 RepID=A0A1J4K822_9EUKA|nr:hypothetical protein TRFO_26657 [Tritrichomonas foetus]|eukprot:OHT05581.1 hypothetical protein TRFO_26657 [Tritrichomonas foetus]
MSQVAIHADYSTNPNSGVFAQWGEILGDNIARKSAIFIRSSTTSIKSRDLVNIVDPNYHQYIISHSKHNTYIDFDLKDHQLNLTKYKIRTGPTEEGVNHLRSWSLLCSNDGQNFTTLENVEKSDALNGFEKVYVSNDIVCSEPYRYFRLLMTGKNHSRRSCLFLQHIEFFGLLMGAQIVNPFKNYSQSEIESLREVFEKIDKDGSGELDSNELSIFLENHFPLPKKMIPIAFRVCDKDNSGTIGFDEFLNFFNILQTLKSDDPIPAYRMLFGAIDVEIKNSLDVNQLLEFCLFANHPISQEEAQQIIQEHDSDGDGRLSFEDIYSAILNPKTYTSIKPRAYTKTEQEQLRIEFDSIDEDGNGQLNRDELEKFCGSENGIGVNAVELIFLLVDSDNSGTITFDEYLEFCNLMVVLSSDENEFFQKIFNAVAGKENGTLGVDELERFYRLVGADMSRKQIRKLIKANDSDRDQRLTFAEAADI